MRPLYITLLLALPACAARHETQTPSTDARLETLRAKDAQMKDEAQAIRDPVNGWLVTDCDGMLWTGKYAAVSGVTGVDILAAEAEPGKFLRSPEPCSSENPDWSDWSKDMGAGFLAYAWRQRDLAAIERHAAYGRAHPALANGVPVWQMGVPVGDGRGLYLPAFIGRLYQTQLALGGAEDSDRAWPDAYFTGLTDYRAHLQVMNIWHRGEVAEALRVGGDGDATVQKPVTDDAGQAPGAPLTTIDVSGSQLDRLKEHAARDPRDPLFQAVLGVYTGDMGPALDALLADDDYAGEYVRCEHFRECQLAAWLFAADIVLRRFGDQP